MGLPLPSSFSQRMPLYHRPGTVVLVDRHQDQIEAYRALMPVSWSVRSFLSQDMALNHLQQEPPKWEADLWAQQQILEGWRSHVPLVPQILWYWATHHARYDVSRVLVTNAMMPPPDHSNLLGELLEWPPARILVNGDGPDAGLAAVNEGLADRVIDARLQGFEHLVVGTVAEMLAAPNPREQQLWSATLTPQQRSVLDLPAVAQQLRELAATTWVEWVVIGEPFGIIGVDAKGNVTWLQLELTSNLAEAARLAEQGGAARSEVEDIAWGRSLSNIEFKLSMGSHQPASVTAAFAIGEGGELRAALHSVSAKVGSEPLAYSKWLVTNGLGRRSVNESCF